LKEITASGAAVAAPYPQCADAARALLMAGGTAVDAAVAAMLATCVLSPPQVGIGGYGGTFVFYRAETKTVHAIDFDSKSPYAYKPGLFPNADVAQSGPLSIAVPGIVAGLALSVKKFGKKKWADVAAPAIRLADEGFPVSQYLSDGLKKFAATADKTSVHALLPTGRAPAPDERWVQKDLANLLRRINDDPMSFYRGEIPRAIVKQVAAAGGILAEEDFTRYEPHLVEPLRINYKGYELFTPPPPAGGLTTLAILKTLEGFGIDKREPWGAQYLELFAEASKLCWDERRKTLGDPDFVKPPIEEMLSEKSAAARAERIRSGKWFDSKPVPDEGEHTCNIVAVDRDRNVVSLTATQGDGWGSFVAIDGLGLSLGHGMSRFTYTPNSPNNPAPGKRMQHNMSPVIILRDGKPYGAVGMAGGTRIVTVTGQLLINLLEFKTTPAKALQAPRVHTEGDEPLHVTSNLPEAVFNELQLMGHQVERRETRMGGPMNAAVLTGDGRINIATGGSEGGLTSI
jgi:gamma-glutamyltranspeptidase/glutathione hydrolase